VRFGAVEIARHESGRKDRGYRRVTSDFATTIE